MSTDRLHPDLCTCDRCMDEAFPHLGDHREEIDAVTLDSGVPTVGPELCDGCQQPFYVYAYCEGCDRHMGCCICPDPMDGPQNDNHLLSA